MTGMSVLVPSRTPKGPNVVKREIEKSDWGEGPWQHEADEEVWAFGDVECRWVRHPRRGHLNGYVGLPPSHPWFGQGYDSESEIGADVHGGLTFAGRFSHGTFATPTNEHLWYIGFDCHHAWDLAPGTNALYRERGAVDLIDHDETYRTIEYVKAETEALARQAIEAQRVRV